MSIARFTGTTALLCLLDPFVLRPVVAWISTIPWAAWPQQPEGVPAMVNDLAWHGFGARTDALVKTLLQWFPGCTAENRMLSVVMPGARIAPHQDLQTPAWRTRVHVPLVTDSQALFLMEGVAQGLAYGFAYLVNTEREHAVAHDGQVPRVHFMCDVRLS